ncbi:MAG: fatty acid desaturase, partial [Xanthomonadales bacterium]|nr:fatty acid desaturase [Xanthomonadales bacterium]
MKALTRHFHEPAGLAWHGAALAYALGAYALGWVGVFSSSPWLYGAGVLALAHGMVIAAYLVHECGHNTIFRSNRANARLGTFLAWVTGACYGTFEDIRYKHFRHHMDNDDVVWFMYAEFFDRHPRILRLVQSLEWALLPAHEFLMHGLAMVSAFVIPERRAQRARQAVIMLVRVGAFVLIALLAPWAALGYVLAYMLMLHVLRFMDAQQHDYGAYPSLFDEALPSRFGGRKTEQAHTFSNPISWRHDWLNWLTLNFGWHNAHHARPTVPWYRLRDYYL